MRYRESEIVLCDYAKLEERVSRYTPPIEITQANENVYTKMVFLDDRHPVARVYRNGEQVTHKSWILWNNSLKNRERKLKKAHKWADKAIEILKIQETTNPVGNWLSSRTRIPFRSKKRTE